MKNKSLNSLFKHLDFIIIDFICIQIAFLLGHWIRFGIYNPYVNPKYLFEDVVFVAAQLLFVLFSTNYKNILKRKPMAELIAVVTHITLVVLMAILFLYLSHSSNDISRLQVGYTSLAFVPLSFILRQLNKKRLYRIDKSNPIKGKRSIALVTSSKVLDKAMENLTAKDRYHDYFISQIFLLDKKASNFRDKYENVYDFSDDAIDIISHDWVDEVLIIEPDDMPSPKQFMNDIYQMGITLNYTMDLLNEEYLTDVDVQKIGKYKVYSSNLKTITIGEQLLKRLLDIIGSIVGIILTLLLTIIVGPIIYIKSPGPIFFSQERVGKNGKTFKMYKFRSMYLDAEERKEELLGQNERNDDFMFKMEDDPRIIGSEKKDKNGKPRGIGNFIRRTSIDEFPQFWNVLKGDMSLVGTRPPTVDEWEMYNLSHRIRMSTKPGITGLWQISGRSDIVDFDEVVRLDRQYIEEWSIWLDISILLKTVGVVIRSVGAE